MYTTISLTCSNLIFSFQNNNNGLILEEIPHDQEDTKRKNQSRSQLPANEHALIF